MVVICKNVPCHLYNFNLKFDFSQSPLLISVSITMTYHPLTLQMSIPLDLVCCETAGLAFAKITPELGMAMALAMGTEQVQTEHM